MGSSEGLGWRPLYPGCSQVIMPDGVEAIVREALRRRYLIRHFDPTRFGSRVSRLSMPEGPAQTARGSTGSAGYGRRHDGRPRPDRAGKLLARGDDPGRAWNRIRAACRCPGTRTGACCSPWPSVKPGQGRGVRLRRVRSFPRSGRRPDARPHAPVASPLISPLGGCGADQRRSRLWCPGAVQARLTTVLTSYAEHFKHPPAPSRPRPVPTRPPPVVTLTSGSTIRRTRILGGLINEYRNAA